MKTRRLTKGNMQPQPQSPKLQTFQGQDVFEVKRVALKCSPLLVAWLHLLPRFMLLSLCCVFAGVFFGFASLSAFSSVVINING